MQERGARDNGRDSVSRARGNERRSSASQQMFSGSAVANQAELSLFAELCSQNVLSRDECFIRKINFLHVNDAELDVEY